MYNEEVPKKNNKLSSFRKIIFRLFTKKMSGKNSEHFYIYFLFNNI